MPIFLWMALCFNHQCTDQQVFQFKQFDKVTKTADCRKAKEEAAKLLSRSGNVVSFRLTCKTNTQFTKEGFDNV